MAEAGPVFIVAGVVFAVAAVWVVWVNVRPGKPWAEPPSQDEKPG